MPAGHDGHTTMLLGAAQYLAETRNFDGTAVLIFQPAEEGGGGGEVMLKDGLFDKFPVDTVWGLHNWPGLDVGKVVVQREASMAAGRCVRSDHYGSRHWHAAYND